MSSSNKKSHPKTYSSSEDNSSSSEIIKHVKKTTRSMFSPKTYSSSEEEKAHEKTFKDSSSEEFPVTFVTKPNQGKYSSDEESPSSSEEEYLDKYLPKELVGMVRSYTSFTGEVSDITNKVNCVASHDEEKIYYLSYNDGEKDSRLIRLDLKTGKKRSWKLNLEEYEIIPVGCSKKKNFLFISSITWALLLDLKSGRVIYSGKFDMRPRTENHIEIVSITKENVTILSTPRNKKFRITVISIKTGEIILTKDIATRSSIRYVGTGPAGEIIFLKGKKLVKYY